MKQKLLFLLPLLVILSACSVQVGDKAGIVFDGGVFASNDNGKLWRQMTLVPSTTGTPGNINYLGVNRLVIDPSDDAAIYLGSVSEGLYYTYNINNGWQKAIGVPNKKINDIAVDPIDKCTIYIATENRVFRTRDCNRTFEAIYYDPEVTININTLVVDWKNHNNVYLGNSRGDVLKSENYGQSWQAIQRLDRGVAKIAIHPQKNNLVFVASTNSMLYRFDSSAVIAATELQDFRNKFDGKSWTDLNSELQQFSLGSNFKGLAFCPNDNTLLLATDQVILRSIDNGAAWAKLKLVTPDANSVINDIAFNPQNSQEIYYITNTTFFASIDGGENWRSAKLPTSRAGITMAVEFKDPRNIYLGVQKLK